MKFKQWHLWLLVAATSICVTFMLIRRPSASPAPVGPSSSAEKTRPQAGVPTAQPEPLVIRDAPPENPAAGPEAELAALEKLAAADYNAALAQALREPNEERRANLLQAVLRGWASKDIRAAGLWAKNQSYLFRDLALAAVFNGGAKNAVAAEKYARELSAAEPEQANSYGGYLIHGLGLTGQHRAAAKFALGDTATGEKGWLVAAYSDWATKEPAPALFSADEIGTPEHQRNARNAVFTSWARTNPVELANIAVNYAEGQDRKIALTAALRAWIQKDPAAAAEWIAKQKFSPEMEAALEE